jgi:hypothetical protein
MDGKMTKDSGRPYYPSHHPVNSPEAGDERDTELCHGDIQSVATVLIVADDRLVKSFTKT